MTDAGLMVRAMNKADASVDDAFRHHKVPAPRGRNIIGSADELRAAVDVLDRLMAELYDADVYKDIGTCIEIVTVWPAKRGDVPPIRQRWERK